MPNARRLTVPTRPNIAQWRQVGVELKVALGDEQGLSAVNFKACVAAVATGLSLFAFLCAPTVSAQGTPQAAYDQLCGARATASPATCAALRKELQDSAAPDPAANAPAQTPSTPAGRNPMQVVLSVEADVRNGGKTAGSMGARYAQHTFQARLGYYYTVKLEATDRISVAICDRPEPGTFSCFGKLDTWTIRSWEVGGEGTRYLTVKGFQGKGTYKLEVEERPVTADWERQWFAQNAVLKALPGQVFLGQAGTIVSFVKGEGGAEVRIAESNGRFHRSAPLLNMKSNVGKGRFVFSGEEWVAKNVNSFNVASLVGSDSIATYHDRGFGDHFRILPSGDLQTTRFAGDAPQNYFILRRLPPNEAARVLIAYEAARQSQFQAAQQHRADRDAMIAQLVQGALVVGQGYAAGMQEANEANARSQAIIDAAAESDRQYRAAQRAIELAQQASQQSSSSPPLPQAREAEDRQRREAQQPAQDPELRRQQEAQQQEQERQRRAQVEREAETRRQDQQRQRDAAEAERTRMIDFKEAVVLCELSGAQAQFGNWRCEGPLQMNYADLNQGNYAFAFDQMACGSFRELPRAGPYRAFGCGYGLHPTNPGASRNVPEMLGVFVDGRITFRCPRNISGVCRSQ